MNYFKKQLFGYSINEVERYFTDLECNHKTLLSQKESELDLIREKINHLQVENNNLFQELDILNKKKANFMNYVNNRVEEIENLVNNKHTESQELKKAAIQKLTIKKNELTNVQNCLKEFKNDLTYIKYRQKQAVSLLENKEC